MVLLLRNLSEPAQEGAGGAPHGTAAPQRLHAAKCCWQHTGNYCIEQLGGGTWSGRPPATPPLTPWALLQATSPGCPETVEQEQMSCSLPGRGPVAKRTPARLPLPTDAHPKELRCVAVHLRANWAGPGKLPGSCSLQNSPLFVLPAAKSYCKGQGILSGSRTLGLRSQSRGTLKRQSCSVRDSTDQP